MFGKCKMAATPCYFNFKMILCCVSVLLNYRATFSYMYISITSVD